jgi:dolichyldiphosphatase
MLILTLIFDAAGLCACFSKLVLQKCFNQTRPAGSVLSDPGMPSSHAMSLFFIGTYVVLLLQTAVPAWVPASSIEAQILVLEYAIAAALWRVKAKLHSLDQVRPTTTLHAYTVSSDTL